MQISEEDLPGSQHRALDRLRLLDLDDHFRRRVDIGRMRRDRRPFARVIVVVDADPDARTVLDDDGMAMMDELAYRARCESDAILEDLDLLRNADAHARSRQQMDAREITRGAGSPLGPASYAP